MAPLFAGVRRSQAKAPLWDADQNVGWLTNKNLTNAIMTAVADLSAIINKEESCELTLFILCYCSVFGLSMPGVLMASPIIQIHQNMLWEVC